MPENVPVLPRKDKVVAQGFDDPPILAEGVHDEEEAMETYRRVSDEIKAFVEQLPGTLTEDQKEER